jgi:hypothetical protein
LPSYPALWYLSLPFLLSSSPTSFPSSPSSSLPLPFLYPSSPFLAIRRPRSLFLPTDLFQALLEPTLKKLDLQGNPLRIEELEITADTPVADIIKYLKTNLCIAAPLLMYAGEKGEGRRREKEEGRREKEEGRREKGEH